jgi:hypothetical protein
MAPGAGTAAKAGMIAVGLAGTVIALGVLCAGPPLLRPVGRDAQVPRHAVALPPIPLPPQMPEPILLESPAVEEPTSVDPAAATGALAAALWRLANDQQPDGRWAIDDESQDAPGTAVAGSDGTELDGLPAGLTDVGRTALALIAFLRAGYTPTMSPMAKPHADHYREIMLRGFWWLSSQRAPRSGWFGDKDDACANQAMAVLATAVAFDLTGDETLRRMAGTATDALLRRQHRLYGDDPETIWRGWSTNKPSVIPDEATTAWVALALTAARSAGAWGLHNRQGHGIAATLQYDPRQAITPVRVRRDVRYIIGRLFIDDTAEPTPKTTAVLMRLTDPLVISQLPGTLNDPMLFALGSAVITHAPPDRRKAWATAVLDVLVDGPAQTRTGVPDDPDPVTATALTAWTIASLTVPARRIDRERRYPIEVSSSAPSHSFATTFGPALRALASMQLPDGSWPLVASDSEGAFVGSPDGMTTIGRTAFVLGTFSWLGYSHTEKSRPWSRYRGLMRRGLDFLLAAQADDGWIGGDDPTINHAMATHALIEAYEWTGDVQVKAAAIRAVDALAARQLRQPDAPEERGGWPADSAGATADTPTTLWAAMAMKSARNARFELPDGTFAGAETHFGTVQGTGDLFADAGFVFASIVNSLDGIRGSDDTRVRAAMDRLTSEVLRAPDAVAPLDIALLFHGAAAAHQMGRWCEHWKPALFKILLPLQRHDAPPPDADPGVMPPEFGIWDADDRAFATAAALWVMSYDY